MKVALGTVQFGLTYGINNPYGIPTNAEIASIFDIAAQNNVSMLDTASMYGNAEEKIGTLSRGRFSVVTKFFNAKSPKALTCQFAESLEKLGMSSVYGYIAHNADEIINNRGLWDTLRNFREESKTEKIGYSIYTVEQLERLLELDFIPDLIQFPYSLLDRKFERYFEVLKQLNTQITVRSVFLQGLYLKDLQTFPGYLQPLKRYVEELNGIAAERNLSITELALGYVNSKESIDNVILGVDNSTQLELNLKYSSTILPREVIDQIDSIIVEESHLLYPYNWK